MSIPVILCLQVGSFCYSFLDFSIVQLYQAFINRSIHWLGQIPHDSMTFQWLCLLPRGQASSTWVFGRTLYLNHSNTQMATWTQANNTCHVVQSHASSFLVLPAPMTLSLSSSILKCPGICQLYNFSRRLSHRKILQEIYLVVTTCYFFVDPIRYL